MHELHNDYPLAPEKREISHNILSNYCSRIANEYNIVGVLVPNLCNKSKFVLHYRNLQLYLSIGINLTKLRKILKFKQSDRLKKYIDFNRDERKNLANRKILF